MNWPVIIIVGIVLIALIIFLVKRNIKDEKEVEAQLKQDEKPHDEKVDEGNNEPVV